MRGPSATRSPLGPLLALAVGVAAGSYGLGAMGEEQLALPARMAPPGAPLPPFEPLVREDDGLPGVPVALEDPGGHALDHAFRALDRVAEGHGTTRWTLYGGSHTASDLFVGRLRELMQARFGDAGHGFVPMAPVVRHHWVWGMSIAPAEGFEVQQVGFKRREVDRYGPAGVRFVGYEDGAFAAVASDTWGTGRLASHLELLYDRAPGGGDLDVLVDGRAVARLATDAPAPEPGLLEVDVSLGPHRLEVRVRGERPVVTYGVRYEGPGPGIVVDNLGLVGSKARHQLLWDEEQWAWFLARQPPDLVALAYGNNETVDPHLTVAEHEAHLREVIARHRRHLPEASCLLIGPTNRPARRDDGSLAARPVVADLTDMFRRVAADEGCAFFDTLRFQGGLGAGIAWLRHDPPYMRDDLVHLSREGYLRWGEALHDAVLRGYRAYRGRR
ncbi:MAG: GDSL-type esterase/lipase family protein [Sandaracinaceae bacterium]